MSAHPSRSLVVTVGPSSFRLVAELVQAGATALRLNTSHLSTLELVQAARSLRDAAPLCPIVLDLQGAKMRLGRFEARELRPGDRIRFVLEPDRDTDIPVVHPELFAAVGAGETISVDDAKLRFSVERVSPTVIEATCIVGGTVLPRKGVNRSEQPAEPSDLRFADVRAIEATRDLGGVEYALSFVRDAAELEWIRRRAPGARVTAKIERREAIDALASIADRADALWVCRGDLGAQLGLVSLARAVGRIDPCALPRPVLMAGQVLEHLTDHAEPTRSEVCHLADLLDRGYAGVVLSDETAIGRDPVRAARTAATLLASL